MIKIDLPYNNGLNKDGFVIVFVYPKIGDPYIVTGLYTEVSKFVHETSKIALLNVSFWKLGKCRASLWKFIGKCNFIRKIPYTNKRFELTMFDSKTTSIKKTFRRMPHKWIPEFDLGMDK